MNEHDYEPWVLQSELRELLTANTDELILKIKQLEVDFPLREIVIYVPPKFSPLALDAPSRTTFLGKRVVAVDPSRPTQIAKWLDANGYVFAALSPEYSNA
jgi:hypothetical protein